MIGGSGTYTTASSLGMETSSHGHGGSISEDFVRPIGFLKMRRLLTDDGREVSPMDYIKRSQSQQSYLVQRV